MSLRKTSIKDSIKELGLPEGSKFCGYVVYLPNEDEFLAQIISTKSIDQKIFVKTPGDANIYQAHKKAIRDSKKCKQETDICLLFDVGSQLLIVSMGK